jgi:hypothetical protein
MKYKEPTPIQKLDEVLKCLIQSIENPTTKNIFKIIPDYITENIDELEQILFKLYKDGYVHLNEQWFDPKYLFDNKPELKREWKISFAGKLLITQGGYEKLISKATSENLRIESLEKRTYLSTFWMAVATCITAAYCIYQIAKDVFCH